ncbi:helix-turn-helix domain-containing protein [Bacillus sp. Gen3]|nr:helix-turn-helix domain-containing protein [Bacillus sp. Gen3]
MALKKLNAEHYLAIKWLAQPKFGGKTLGEIAQICEVTERTLYNWRQDPLFERELKREMVRFQQGKLPEVISNIYTVAAESENAAMAKLVLQLNEMLTEKHDVTTGDKKDGIDYEALDEEIASFGKVIGNDGE